MGKLLFEAFVVYIIIQVVFLLIRNGTAPKQQQNKSIFRNTTKPSSQQKNSTKKDEGDFVDYEEVN